MRTILSLCDFTGNWPQPYAEAGYKVISVDLKHGTDVRLMEAPEEPIHGVLAAPPCTVFANSGARWPRTTEEMLEGLSIVDACLRIITTVKPVWWALENPVGKLRRYLGRPTMYFDPCEFGDPYTKKTALWGNFTPPSPLFSGGDKSVEPALGSLMHTAVGGKSEATKAFRSATPLGFARAFFEANP